MRGILPPGYSICPGCHMNASRSEAGTLCATCEERGVNPSAKSNQAIRPTRAVGEVVRGGRQAASAVFAPGSPARDQIASGPAHVRAAASAAASQPKRSGRKSTARAEASPEAERQMSAEISEVKFRLDGLPVPKERPRTFVKETTNDQGVTSRKSVTITPEDTKAFEAEVKLVSAQARKKVSADLLPGLLRVELYVFCESNMARADMDNVLKAILDGMQGAVYADDNLVDSAEYVRDRFHTGRPYAMVRVVPFVPPSKRR